MAHLGSRVAAFVDGQLSADAVDDARAHLEGCAPCRDAVRAQQRLKQRMTSLGSVPAPPPALLSQLCALQSGVAAERPTPWRRAVAALTSARAGACVLVTGTTAGVAAAAFVLGGPAPSTSAETTPPVEAFVADFGAAASAPQGGVVQAALASQDLVAGTRAGSDDATARTLLAGAGDSVADLDGVLAGADVRLGGAGVVAGIPATEVVVSRSGRREVAYWISRSTGRAVRAVAYDHDGTPRERAVATTAAATTGTPLTESAMLSLTRSGWPCHEQLSDDLRRVEGALVRGHGGGQDIVSLEYADAASRLTLHEQAGALDEEELDGFRRARLATTHVWLREGRGPEPTVATWDRDGIVYTIVTDTDLDRLAGVVADLPHTIPAGPVDRVQRGLVRMTRWADPLSP